MQFDSPLVMDIGMKHQFGPRPFSTVLRNDLVDPPVSPRGPTGHNVFIGVMIVMHLVVFLDDCGRESPVIVPSKFPVDSIAGNHHGVFSSRECIAPSRLLDAAFPGHFPGEIVKPVVRRLQRIFIGRLMVLENNHLVGKPVLRLRVIQHISTPGTVRGSIDMIGSVLPTGGSCIRLR